MQPSIIYEDGNVLILNKPAGLMVHPDGKSAEPTLADWIAERYPTLAEVGEAQLDAHGEPLLRPGLVHRLDRETSGVIAVAKTQEAFEHLKEQFKNRLVEKVYCALVYGAVQIRRGEEGSINAPIGRSRVSGRWTAVRPGEKTREALTEDRLRERFRDYTVLTVIPRTGRTHQIRVNLKSIGHAVVCDKVYAPKPFCPVAGLSRLGLHAEALSFTLPSGKWKSFSVPLPGDLAGALEALRNL